MITRRSRCSDDFLRERLDAAIALARERSPPGPRPAASSTARATGCRRWWSTATATTSSIQTLSQATEALKDEVVAALVELLQPKGILERNDPKVRTLEGLEQRVGLLHGEVPDVVEVQEDGLRFEADLWKGQKTGLFLDQRENHAMARGYARGRVLDAFSYNGGFALQVARAGGRGARGRRVRGRDRARAAQRRAQRHREREDAGGQRLRPAARAGRVRPRGSTP